jgi:hypothetical protein
MLGDLAVMDPQDLNSQDVVVLIKVCPEDYIVDTAAQCYMDVIDSTGTFHALDRYPQMKAIAISRLAYNYLSERYGEDRVVFIPEHNCNFDRALRITEWPIKSAGYIGEAACFHCDVDELRSKLKEVGVSFEFCTKYKTRKDVLDFYGMIDLQITFRVDEKHIGVPAMLKNPLKLNNAGSCGIPSISYPEANYIDEWEGCFWPATSIDEIIDTIHGINNSKLMYQCMQSAAIGRAETYHIERIIGHYIRLLEDAGKGNITTAPEETSHSRRVSL